jgi:hypothetical protein
MVKLLDPLGSSEARGKIGGLVYNTWRGISYARTKVSPANPNTPARLAARAIAKQVTARWQVISDLQRSWWNDYAWSHLLPDWRGKRKRLTGFNWFMKANFSRLALGLPIVDTPPAAFAPGAVSALTAVTDGNKIVIDWILPPDYTAASQQVDIWITYPMSAGRRPKIQDSKHLAFVPAEDGTFTTPPVLPASYGIFARTVLEENGLSSPWRLVEITREAISYGSVGPSYPTIGESLLPEIFPWDAPENIRALDGSPAYIEIAPLDSSDILSGSHFDFSPPALCSILGVKARVYFPLKTIGLLTAQLRAATGPIGNPKPLACNGDGDVWVEWGSSTDKWGAPLTSAIVAQDAFGLDLVAQNLDVAADLYYADVFELTVYYST